MASSKDFREQPIEELIRAVEGQYIDAGVMKAAARLAARLTFDLANTLGEVRAGLFDVKKSLVEQGSGLTTALSAASTQASQQTDALVRWTKTLVLVTGAYTFITGGLLIVAIWSVAARP